MNYTVDDIIDSYEWDENLDYLFFWGHTKTNGPVTYACFSQWYDASFSVDDIKYITAEHWMMSEKAKLFNDNDAYDKIIKAKTPNEAKQLGREVKGFDETIWDEHKYDIVVQGNIYKFSQNSELLNFLKSTKEQILVEASPNDAIWGVGMAVDNEEIRNPNKWVGENLLGFALMEVRDSISDIEKQIKKRKFYKLTKIFISDELSMFGKGILQLIRIVLTLVLLFVSFKITAYFAQIFFDVEYNTSPDDEAIFVGDYTDVIVLLISIFVFNFIFNRIKFLKKKDN